MLLAAPPYHPPPGAIVLVIGAAFALLGNSMVMVAPWRSYGVKNRGVWMKKSGALVSVVGSVFAVAGAADALKDSGEWLLALGLLLVALAMLGLLLAPVFLSGQPSVNEVAGKQPPCNKPQSPGGLAIAVAEGVTTVAKKDDDLDSHEGGGKEDGVEHRQRAEAPAKASEL
jgi:hypothetical protein